MKIRLNGKTIFILSDVFANFQKYFLKGYGAVLSLNLLSCLERGINKGIGL
jgi:hypothetical protein